MVLGRRSQQFGKSDKKRASSSPVRKRVVRPRGRRKVMKRRCRIAALRVKADLPKGGSKSVTRIVRRNNRARSLQATIAARASAERRKAWIRIQAAAALRCGHLSRCDRRYFPDPRWSLIGEE